MKLYDLGHLPGQGSMTVFHALGYLEEEAVVVVSPGDRLVSVGFFQDANSSVDLDYCREAGIEVMRREIGGGTTFLDEDQVFYQVILRRDNPLAKGSISGIYERFSEVPINTYERLGIPVRFKPVNDIVTLQGRKVAGEGGGDIGGSRVFVGGILMDFDYRTMCRVLRVPDEKFRDKLYKSLEENLTTVMKETGSKPERSRVVEILIEEFEGLFGKLDPSELTPSIKETMREVEDRLGSEESINRKSAKGRAAVKVSSDVQVYQQQHKAPGGLITTLFEVKGGKIHDLNVWGDFTLVPVDVLGRMEGHLEGVDYVAGEVERSLVGFWQETGLDFPGVTIEDIVSALGL